MTDTQLPLLSLILFMPLVAMLLVMAAPKDGPDIIRTIAAFFMGVAMMLSIKVYADFYILSAKEQATFQFVEQMQWVPRLGISFILGVDGLNAPMILLAGILGFAVSLVSFNIKERVKEYYALALASIAGVFGIFLSLDMFFFILFYEMASVPMYFLVGMWGSVPKSGRRVSLDYAATKLIIYLQLGGGLAFLGILGLYFSVPVGHQGTMPIHSFSLIQLTEVLRTTTIPWDIQRWLFPLIFIGFAIEAGFFPFHTWLPDGHSSAPTALSMLLAGVLLKMGGYGAIRLGIATMPQGAEQWMPIFMAMAVVNVLYGALCALKQTDIKYLIAYSSISHMGIVILGMGTFNMAGMQGAIYQMFSHGIVTALLFALAGYIYEKSHTRNIEEMGGLAVKMPFLAACWALAGLASLGLPGMSGFVAELMVFFGLYVAKPTMAILAVLGLVITATYILRATQKILFGPISPEHEHHVVDAVGPEPYPLALLAIVAIIFGVWPNLLIHVMNPGVEVLVKSLGGS